MRILLQLAMSVSIYRVATCYDRHLPASLGEGDKGHSFTIPSSQLTFKDKIGTVKVPRSWLQALLSLGNWSVIGPLEHTGLQKKPQPGNSIFPPAAAQGLVCSPQDGTHPCHADKAPLLPNFIHLFI